MPEALRNFDIAFEEARGRELVNLDPLERSIKRETYISYNVDQMTTNLGERFNVISSTYQYDIKDGQLWGKDMNEPALESFRRGKDYRRENGNAVDFRREDAEVIGFEKIQKIMTDESTPDGTMVMSVSQPGLEGSIYKLNFIDFHIKKRDEQGRSYMESSRVSSGLNMEETLDKIKVFAPVEIDSSDPAASLLENPIVIEGGLSIDDVRFYLYKDHDYMDQESFGIVRRSVSHLVMEYAKSLADRPEDTDYHRLIFNTILNKADEIAESIKINGTDSIKNIQPIPTPLYIRQEIENYGYKEVREVDAGCGMSSGYELEMSENPYSVSEFGSKKDKYGERSFKCPACHRENVRPHNKLLSHCQHCRSTEVAC